MDINIIVGIAGFILTASSLLYAVYITKKSKREKSLVYEVMHPAPIATVIKSQSAYSLKVVYEKPNEAPVYIEHALVQYVRFTNFGRLPINKNDLAQMDPLRIEISGGKVLDISVIGVTRDICQIAVGTVKSDNTSTTATISFEFLDYLDGGLFQILSDNAKLQTSLKGTVVGMPEGIKKEKVIPEDYQVLPNWGCVTMTVVYLVALGGISLIYRYATGRWTHLWLLLVPLALLVVVLILTMLIIWTVGPRREFNFPDKLLPPRWYRMRGMLTTGKMASHFPVEDIGVDVEEPQKAETKADRKHKKSKE